METSSERWGCFWKEEFARRDAFKHSFSPTGVINYSGDLLNAPDKGPPKPKTKQIPKRSIRGGGLDSDSDESE